MSQERKASLLDRPLTARSILASLLLGMHPPRLSSARLVRWCSAFGVSEGTARVALSRMVERGELRAEAGVYELVGPVRDRQSAQDWGLEPHLEPWDGQWTVGMVAADRRRASERAALRAAAARARLGELREGIWTRPANLPRASATAADWDVLDDQCQWWRGAPDEPAETLATRLFAPERWAERGRMLLGRLDGVLDGLAKGETPALADAFVVGAASLQHLRHDPLLPASLLPAGWPGEALRTAYQRYRSAFGDAVATFLR